MRVWDTENLIYDGLRALPWLRYLSAMWILCGEIRSLFEDRLTSSEQVLISSTMDVVREVVTTGEVRAATGLAAAELVTEWQQLISERQNEVLPGQWNAWITFELLTAELAGTADRYEATERLTLAATERWREPYPGKARMIDKNEEIDDSSPMARTLATFGRVVTHINQAGQLPRDPATVRAQVILEPPWISRTKRLFSGPDPSLSRRLMAGLARRSRSM